MRMRERDGKREVQVSDGEEKMTTWVVTVLALPFWVAWRFLL